VTNSVVIRTARPEERRALEELQRRASTALPDYREALLANPDAILLPPEHIAHCVVAERAGERLGFAVMLPRGDGDAELDGLFVEPASWKQGIGRLLVLEAVRRAASAGARWLCVIANPTALGFYLSCGFQRQGDIDTQFGKGILMRAATAP
jgi:GNAT superfamily N-acetyltransferase